MSCSFSPRNRARRPGRAPRPACGADPADDIVHDCSRGSTRTPRRPPADPRGRRCGGCEARKFGPVRLESRRRAWSGRPEDDRRAPLAQKRPGELLHELIDLLAAAVHLEKRLLQARIPFNPATGFDHGHGVLARLAVQLGDPPDRLVLERHGGDALLVGPPEVDVEEVDWRSLRTPRPAVRVPSR